MAEPELPPAYRLAGLKLSGGWNVLSRHDRPKSLSGGAFSVGYFVENSNGRLGYLKALDFSKALRSMDPPRSLQALTMAFNYERDLLAIARSKNMSRVAHSIDDGIADVDPNSVIGNVPFLVFERADGDVRAIQGSKAFDNAWVLRCLHQLAVGLSQLNSNGIAHQDLKPSNALVFGGNSTKLADLGRAVLRGANTPYDGLPIAGDRAYAPPELQYYYTPSNWDKHRVGCDLYQLGSMFVFLFSQTTINALLALYLDPRHLPMTWNGTFEDVLPFLQMAFSKALSNFASSLPMEIRAEIIEMVDQLCNPDPERRGHPKNRIGFRNPYSLERYVSRLDLLARKAERGLLVSS